MNILEIWLLALALAVDCFSVSVACGLASKRLILSPMALMALSFGVFQGGMTLIGYYGTTFFSSYIESVDHWIAFGLLMYLGVNMIREGMKGPEEDEGQDSASMLTLRSILTLSVATSIDALAVGISLACVNGEGILLSSAIIGICSTMLSIVGLSLGIGMGKVVNLRAELLGGIVLICIGIKILIEHLS